MRGYRYIFLLFLSTILSCGGSAAPTSPAQIPTGISFTGAKMVAETEETITPVADKDFSSCEVVFTDFATGDEDSTGVCGTAEIDGTDINITAPSSLPNLQSECNICFKCEESCLPVAYIESSSSTNSYPDFTAANSFKSQYDLLMSTSDPNETPLTIDSGVINTTIRSNEFEVKEITDGTVGDTIYLEYTGLTEYEENNGTTSYVKKHIMCGITLEPETFGSVTRYTPQRLVVAESTDYLSTAYVDVSSGGYLSTYSSVEDPDAITNGCMIDSVKDSDGNQVTAVIGSGHGSGWGGIAETCFKGAVIFFKVGDGDWGESQEISGCVNDTMDMDLNSSGEAFIAWVNADNNNLYAKKCTSSGCDEEAVLIQENVIDDSDDVGVAADTEGDAYIVYKKTGSNGIENIYTKRYLDPDNSEIQWSNATEATGDAVNPKIAGDIIYERTAVDGITYISEQWIAAVEWIYENSYNMYAAVLNSSVSSRPGEAVLINHDFTPSTLITSGAFFMTMSGNLHIAYVETAGETTTVHYTFGKISGSTLENLETTVPLDISPQSYGAFYVSRVGRFDFIYSLSECDTQEDMFDYGSDAGVVEVCSRGSMKLQTNYTP